MKKIKRSGIVLPVIAVVLLILMAIFYNKNIFLGKTSSYAYPNYNAKPLLTYKEGMLMYLKVDHISDNPTILNAKSDVVINLSNPNSDKKTKCTYNLYFVWENNSDDYIKTDGIEKELVVSGSINGKKIFNDVQLSNKSYGKTLLANETIEIDPSQILNKTIDITFSFYDFKKEQYTKYNKTFAGHVTVDNIICLEEN